MVVVEYGATGVSPVFPFPLHLHFLRTIMNVCSVFSGSVVTVSWLLVAGC